MRQKSQNSICPTDVLLTLANSIRIGIEFVNLDRRWLVRSPPTIQIRSDQIRRLKPKHKMEYASSFGTNFRKGPFPFILNETDKIELKVTIGRKQKEKKDIVEIFLVSLMMLLRKLVDCLSFFLSFL